MLVYLLTFPSGKSYVGQTVRSLDQRLAEHASCAMYPVGRAWRKYGEPQVQILATCSSQAELDRLEAHFIDELGTLSPCGYNLKEGGSGGRPSAETRLRMGRAQKGNQNAVGRPKTEAEVERIRAQGRKPKSPEHRAKIAAAMRGNTNRRKNRAIPEGKEA